MIDDTVARTAPWTARVLTLFPEMFPGPLGLSLAGKALERGIWALDVLDIRDFARDKHRAVDDAPFGGGAGMVMRPDVLDAALVAAKARAAPGTGVQGSSGAPGVQGSSGTPVVYLSPRGRLLDRALARELAQGPGAILLCGRYEGVDERVLEAHGIAEVSVGDYVLSGGEPAALVLIDAVVRLLPGVMGNQESPAEESFERGLLEYPHYTRPAEWQGRKVPEVLVSGHHEKVRQWRRAQAERITEQRRPDLWARYVKDRDDEGRDR